MLLIVDTRIVYTSLPSPQWGSGVPDLTSANGSATPSRDRREELALTQEDLAELAGIHRTYLSDIERGTRNVSLVNIERVAAALALPISELFRLVERS